VPAEAVVGDPVEPGAPDDGPAALGTGTVPTGAGFTTVGLSHALKASAINIAEYTLEYFMRIPFGRLTNDHSKTTTS
jgi:hypothetical protein